MEHKAHIQEAIFATNQKDWEIQIMLQLQKTLFHFIVMQYSELLDPTIGPRVLSLLEHNKKVPPEDMGAVLSKNVLGGK
eukprot:3706830-Rhodomonas_salina.1